MLLIALVGAPSSTQAQAEKPPADEYLAGYVRVLEIADANDSIIFLAPVASLHTSGRVDWSRFPLY